MEEKVKNRILAEADYIVVYHTTIEKTAKHFGVSVATVHSDLTKKLPKLNKRLSQNVRKVLNYNISKRSTRGGRATARKKNNS